MAFDFNELNVQLLPELQQYCPPRTLIGCVCLSRPQTLIGCNCLTQLHTICGCLSNPITIDCACLSKPVTFCQCLSNPQSIGCACLSRPITLCDCLSHAKTFCICNSLPIASYPIKWDELEILRNQLNETLKQVDIAQKTVIPQTEQAFDAQAQDLKRQLDAIEKQREDFRKATGGVTAGKK